MHNLEYNEEKRSISFASARESAWHKLGQTASGAMTTQEAIELGNLDFIVNKVPAFARIYTSPTEHKDVPIPDTYATVREDTQQVLGTVGEKYTILQNRDAFKFFDPILEENEAFIETVGVLGRGERIFITAKMPDHITIFGKDDVIEQYILITSSHDGKSATTVMFTPVRVVCQNTLNAALRGKPNRKSIKHTENQLTRIHLAHEVLGLQNSYRKEIEEIFDRMANTKATEEDYERVIVAGLADKPEMVKNYFSKSARAKQSTRFRGNVKTAMEYGLTNATQTMPSCDMTIFGAYNAVTGYYQNEVNWKDDEDNKMRSIIDTNGRVNLKQQQAWDFAMTLLK